MKRVRLLQDMVPLYERLTKIEKDRGRASFIYLLPHMDLIGPIFYKTLLEQHPELSVLLYGRGC